MVRKIIGLFLFLLLSMVQAPSSMAQTAPSGGNSSISGEEASADTIPHLLLDPVFVTGKLVFKNRRERVRYTKLRRDVLKVLPYAKFAGKKYREMEYELISAKNEKEQKKIIDAIEQDIKDNFEKDLRKLTITQGKILIKLIDRETGRTGYVLLQELKSRFTAFFWQSVARVFGHNLKDQYDPEEEEEIEKVIRSVEMDRYYQLYNGQNYLQVQYRKDQRTEN
ncbi:MAG TPA: DUF4294 domain-containing protein [Anseongella sp.]